MLVVVWFIVFACLQPEPIPLPADAPRFIYADEQKCEDAATAFMKRHRDFVAKCMATSPQ